MNLKGTKSKVSKYFYENKEDVIITGSFWNSDTDYVENIAPYHTGYDYRARTPLGIVSPNNGEVLKTVINNKNGKNEGYGTHIFVYYPTWNVTMLLGHMSKLYYKKGDEIRLGNRLGLTGNTGHSTAPHLHFSLLRGRTTNTNKQNGLWIDVEKFDFVNLVHFTGDLKIGDKVTIKPNSFYQGASKGKPVSKYAYNGVWSILEINTKLKTARLSGINSWLLLSDLSDVNFKQIEVGDIVKIKPNSFYQGASKGKPVSKYAYSNSWQVLEINEKLKTARLSGINSWLLLADLV